MKGEGGRGKGEGGQKTETLEYKSCLKIYGSYVAYNPETGTTTQGDTIDEALGNLEEATELYLEEFPLKTSGHSLLTTFEVSRA